MLDKLAASIREHNPAAPPVRFDPTPTRIVRPAELDRLAGEMGELERRYRESLAAGSDSFVSLHLRDVSIYVACQYVSAIMRMQAGCTPQAIVFRYGPETAAFRAYPASQPLIDALKVNPGGTSYCFERPPPWDESRMMSVDHGTRILFVGSEEEHAEFQRDLRMRRAQASGRVPRM